MGDRRDLFEKLGPTARVQLQLTELESYNRDTWILIVFAASVIVLGALSLLSPSSFWHNNELEMKLPPQVLFVSMMVLVVVALYFMRREMETKRLRLANLQQTLTAQSDYTASLLDTLTNVFNRNFLHELLQGEISRAERNERALALIMCDINDFKQINDRAGHLMGDYVLSQIAAILKSCVRGSDYVVRYGGDEFLIILPETVEVGSEIVRHRIHQKVLEWNHHNRVAKVHISVSLGVYHHVTGDTAEKDLSEVDNRMYRDKQALRTAFTPADHSTEKA